MKRLHIGGRSLLLAVVCAALAIGGCATASGRPPLPAGKEAPTPSPDQVESIVFFVGDAGHAWTPTSPTMTRLQRDVEAWSCRIARDSAVAVVFLGDNIYPSGMHPPDNPMFAQDTAYLNTQIRSVSGPCARRHATAAHFVAGNHDWGQEEGMEGVVRLRRQQDYLEVFRQQGVLVDLRPMAGEPGPAAVDVGRRLRLLFIDTAWWLLGGTTTEKAVLQGRLYAEISSAGGRQIVLNAHHPFQSGGPHGGARSFWGTLGVKFLLSKSGAWLQDLHSRPYRDLLGRLREIFHITGQPLLFAGGHEHSMQVLTATDSRDPQFMLVSGSASKVTQVGFAPGQIFRRAAPGYARLVVRRDGPMDLFIDAMPEGEEHLTCEGRSEADLAACMERGMDALTTVFSQRLLEP